MIPPTKATRAADAIKKLDDSALIAQERIQAAAEKAQKMIDDACAAATQALDNSSQRNLDDRRNIDGSFQWDRGARRASDERLNRLEDKVITINGARGELQVGQAKREEQIVGLIDDCAGIKADVNSIRAEFDSMNKEMTSRMTTLRELILEVKDACTLRIDSLKDDTRKDKIKTQQYVIGIVVGFIVTIAAATLIAFVHLK